MQAPSLVRRILQPLAFPLGLLVCSFGLLAGTQPVILDTDIGDDIDDTWALGLLLKCPELDLRLVVGDHGKNLYRARLLAKMLEAAGRTNVAVGVGADVNRQGEGPQADWVRDYDLNKYPGVVHPDGVRAMVDLIMRSPEPVTLIAVGPLPNVALALKIEPRIAQKARLIGMHGAVRMGYGGNKEVQPEYNVKEDPRACQAAFAAAWPVTITPLDTCGFVDLREARYQKVLRSADPVCRMIVENYRVWADKNGDATRQAFPSRSSTLFDTVAVYLALEERFTVMEELGLTVTDEGFTRIDPAGRKIRVAVSWKDRSAFEEFLAQRLTGTQ